MQHHAWIFIDYKEGWLGFRIEPEDQERANAIKAAIPQDQRKYLSDKRKWLIKPMYSMVMVNILKHYCPSTQVILEDKHWEMIQTLLVGPARYTMTEEVSPQGILPPGRAFGTLEDIEVAW